MAKHLVLGTNRTTPEQDTAFLAVLKARWPNVGWWHRLSETWFVIDPSNTMTAEVLRDLAKEAFPGIHLMAIEIESGIWAGFGTEDMFVWMKDQWQHFR